MAFAAALIVTLVAAGWPTVVEARQDPGAPRILLDQPARMVEYQLSRLTDGELTSLERKDDDRRYRPVYVALLLRKGVARAFRDEALAALVKLDASSPAVVLLDVMAKVPADDPLTADRLLQLLCAQPPAGLRAAKSRFIEVVNDAGAPPLVLRAAYGGLLVADDQADAAWQMAAGRPGHLQALLLAVPALPQAPATDRLRGALADLAAAIALGTGDDDARVAAFGALGWTRRDGRTFEKLAAAVQDKALADPMREAAIRSLHQIPPGVWPAPAIEPLARSLVAQVSATPADRRTEPAALEAIQLGEKLAAALPTDTGRALRRDLRALGVQVIRIETVFEEMKFDRRWFAVEAGKPIQIVLVNNDGMSHNLLVGTPGSLEAIGTAGAAVPTSADPGVKAFVPDLPAVLQSTRLLLGGETERLGFVAPAAPGEYIFVCTFPGHWVRMYGVMLVVRDLEAWEAAPTVPLDPMTGKPFSSGRN